MRTITLDDLMNFAHWIHDTDVYDYCGRGCCSPELNRKKIESEAARWWREFQEKGGVIDP